MKILIFRFTVFLLLILKGLCQYGDTIVGGVGQYTFECHQTRNDVRISPRIDNYEVVAGKPFAYRCEFTIDNRECDHNPRGSWLSGSSCQGVQIDWAIPPDLVEIKRKNGFYLNTQWLLSFKFYFS
jgi:hypothetical protein